MDDERRDEVRRLGGAVDGDEDRSTVIDRFQVLALDGGGAKALFTAHVLARLEADLGIRVTDHFDLIAGEVPYSFRTVGPSRMG